MSILHRAAPALLALSPLATATDLVVTPSGSIQDAIDLAQDGDRVLVQPGTYLERIDFAGRTIEVLGVGGPGVTHLDGGGTGTVVTFTSGLGPQARLAGFSITGGSNSGVVATGATPTLEDCDIHGNVGLWGGGLHGDALLVRCTVRQNTASTGHGGGLWGAPSLYECQVRDNTVTSGSGGGIFFQNGHGRLERCVVSDNRAVFGQGKGGGVYVDSTATVDLVRCVVSGNFGSAGVFGAYGGGVYAEAGGSTVVGCTVLDNLLNGSSEGGGGVYGPVVVRSSIVRGNDVPQLGGGATVSWSNVEGGAAGPGNLDADPLFVDAAAGDLHLLPGSPSIDAGSPSDPLDANGSPYDQGALPFDVPAPSSYCLALPNSAGAGAHMGWSGTTSIAAADLVLTAAGLPPAQPGIFFYGPEVTQVPFGDGLLCVAPAGLGLFRLGPPIPADAGGSVQRPVDPGSPPSAAGTLLPGSTWSFQFWYRDPLAGGSGFNTSDALRVGFVQ